MTKVPLPLVRLAQPEDEENIIDLCKRLWKENGLFALSEEKVRATIRKYYTREGVIVGVIGNPGKLEACTCLQLSDFYYTNDWHLAELWNFVDEPYRKSDNAEALIEFGKSCAIQMQMPFFTGIISNKRMAGKVRLYRRSLGYPTGAFFVFNGNWKPEPMEDHSALRTKLREKAHAGQTQPAPKTYKEVKELLTTFKEYCGLLREASKALESEYNLWGTKTNNGANAA